MKTNTIHIVSVALFALVIALIATSKSAVDFSIVATCIGYATVAFIAAVAAVDCRMNSKKRTSR